MIKAVLFDWVGTLAHPEPDRHEVVARLAAEAGVSLPQGKLLRGFHVAEDTVPSGAPMRWHEGVAETPFIQWWATLCQELGVKLAPETMLDITRRISEIAKKARRRRHTHPGKAEEPPTHRGVDY